MTTNDKLIDMIQKCGATKEQAIEIMSLAKPRIESMNPAYRITWDSRSEDYPDMMYTLWFSIVKPIALEWYNKNLPNAWNKNAFV